MPTPAPQWRKVTLAAALPFALLASVPSHAAAASTVTGTVLHVQRATTSYLTLATTDNRVLRLKGTEKLFKPVTRGRVATITVSGTNASKVTAKAGFAKSVTFPATAERSKTLGWRVTSALLVGASAKDAIFSNGNPITMDKVVGGTPTKLTWTISPSNGAITSTT